MHYLPHTPEDVARALELIGAPSIDALFDDIPAQLRNPDMDVAPGLNEAELMAHLRELAAKNDPAGADFLGGGVRRHFMPSVTSHRPVIACINLNPLLKSAAFCRIACPAASICCAPACVSSACAPPAGFPPMSIPSFLNS